MISHLQQDSISTSELMVKISKRNEAIIQELSIRNEAWSKLSISANAQVAVYQGRI